MKKHSLQNFLRTLGPGLLFASTAIGVSHLVQSTRAGADYGFSLLWAIILANVLKFPFFEYGSRYAAATGESLIDGYKRMGGFYLYGYAFITLATMFFVSAAVGAVTAGFMHQLFALEGLIDLKTTTIILFAFCVMILYLGRYKALDRLIKIIGTVLLLSTIIALISALWRGPAQSEFQFFDPQFLDLSSPAFPFLIALMGWMPTAVDLSAWNSLWTIARKKESGYNDSLKETLREFNFGYWVSALLSPCFMILGAYLIYGTEKSLPSGSAAFAGGIIDLYAETIGEWSRLIISAAAFSIMFGTSIGVFDGYSRAATRIIALMHQGPAKPESTKSQSYRGVLLLVGLGSLLIIFQFGTSLRALVDLATAISFVVAPFIAIANFRLVLGLKGEARPSKALQGLSYLGITFLSVFTLIYLYALWL